ncbi:MAG TPA: hypothetical protein VLC46_21835 [Thermoanaerobaculia bacterium]|jgi:hypothetical protein|nr:hypothetical protein [Thermoanaerobaculia bacterium]
MDTISRARAAAVVKAARATVLEKAQVPDDPRSSAAAWAFARLYDALAENLLASGRDNVAVTYRDLAVLASQRGSGKKTKPSSLRKPFSENVWKGSLLEAPFHDNGLSLDLHLSPVSRRGRPLILTASFSVNGKPIKIDGADPQGDQPILEASRLAQTRDAEAQKQSQIARRLVESLREAGFESAGKLSRWFERQGLHIAPSLIVACLLILVLAATASAAYLIARYVIVHGAIDLKTKPDEQGTLPKGHVLRGRLIAHSAVDGGYMDTRIDAGNIIGTLVLDDLQFRRRSPDSNYAFDWTVVVNGQQIAHRTTPTPEIICPLPKHDPVHAHLGVALREYLQYDFNLATSPDQPPQLRNARGQVIGQGEHLIADATAHGWHDGLVIVQPYPGYGSARQSPMSATTNAAGRVVFDIRHGPVRPEETILNMSFGDGTAWSSTAHPWLLRRDGPGDLWDHYHTAIEHAYAHPGAYPVRFALYRYANAAWNLHREAFGTAYVGVPVPSDAPLTSEWGMVIVDAGQEPGSANWRFYSESTKSLGFHFGGLVPIAVGKEGQAAPRAHITAIGTLLDPFLVIFYVVPPNIRPSVGHETEPIMAVSIDHGDYTTDFLAPGDTFSKGLKVFAMYHEYVQAGTYTVTATGFGKDPEKPLFQINRHIRISADAPPQILE